MLNGNVSLLYTMDTLGEPWKLGTDQSLVCALQLYSLILQSFNILVGLLVLVS